MCDIIIDIFLQPLYINTLTVGLTYTWVHWASGYRPDLRIRICEQFSNRPVVFVIIYQRQK